MEKREIERVKAMVGKHLTRASVDSEGLVSLEYEGGLHLVVTAVRAGRNPSSQPLAESSNCEAGAEKLNGRKRSAPHARRKSGSFDWSEPAMRLVGR
jgi:hypothetical protein